MFLLFKAAFFARQKHLVFNGQNMEFYPKVHDWVDNNINQLHVSFIESKPSKKRIIQMHKWAKPALMKKDLKDDKYNEISKE